MYRGEIVDWVDGDTVWVRRITPLTPTSDHRDTINVRVAHIDTPETNRLVSREAGNAATAYAEALAPPGSACRVHVMGVDSFGRRLAQVDNADGVNVGAELLRAGHAVPYVR